GANALVYDTGGGDPEGYNMASMVILPYLRARGIKRLNTLVISHRDNDHSAGTGSLMASIPVGQLISGGDGPVLYGAQQCRAGKAWRWPSGERFQILSPARPDGLSSNNSSCVLQIRLGAFSLLLPGDVDTGREKQLLRYWREGLHSDVLLAGHHGSLTSSSYTWLKIVQPSYSVFSSGYRNQFSHPRPEILERFASTGSATFTTARDGAVELELLPDGHIMASAFRAGMHPYWM
ncbi:MAG: MBL fold metallo-hydrolase, partial [Proteobacteria bacterium]|nr:MBL fold metallo-hydrolase [Pseudomonadota bacterium]